MNGEGKCKAIGLTRYEACALNVGIMATQLNKDRVMKMSTILLDEQTLEMLKELAAVDELQPGNRSNLLRRLIRNEYKKYLRNKPQGT